MKLFDIVELMRIGENKTQHTPTVESKRRLTFKEYLTEQREEYKINASDEDPRHKSFIDLMKIYKAAKENGTEFPGFIFDASRVINAVSHTSREVTGKQAYRPQDMMRSRIHKLIPLKAIQELLPKDRSKGKSDGGTISEPINRGIESFIHNYQQEMIRNENDKKELEKQQLKFAKMKDKSKFNEISKKIDYLEQPKILSLKRAFQDTMDMFPATIQKRKTTQIGGYDMSKPVDSEVYINGEDANYRFNEFVTWYALTLFSVRVAFPDEKIESLTPETLHEYRRRIRQSLKSVAEHGEQATQGLKSQMLGDSESNPEIDEPLVKGRNLIAQPGDTIDNSAQVKTKFKDI